MLYMFSCYILSTFDSKRKNFYMLYVFMFDRFAKRKLDESSFLGNRLQISYAPEYENVNDTKDKLESRRKEVLARLNRKLSIYASASFMIHQERLSMKKLERHCVSCRV